MASLTYALHTLLRRWSGASKGHISHMLRGSSNLCQPAWLKHGRHSYKIAARIDEVRQRLIVEEGKVSILAPQRSRQGCKLRLHTSQAQA